MTNILDRIVDHKREEVAAAQRRCPRETLINSLADAPEVRDFVAALKAAHPMGLIAEVKRASPSAGLIREDFDPVQIAQIYEQHGAACISVLTDEHFFRGSLDYLEQIRGAVNIPVLRKDFILDPYQVYEARSRGADAILLIAECLDDSQLSDLNALAHELGMSTLIELYDPVNIDRVLQVAPPLIGVNNRNLQTFETSLERTLTLRKLIPEDILLIGESGIHSREDVLRLQNGGAHAILVGESLMRSDDIGLSVQRLLGNASSTGPSTLKMSS